MPSVEAIRNLTLRARTDGYDAATSATQNLARAQDAVTVASEKTEKATLSMAKAWEAQQKRLDATYKATAQYEAEIKKLNAAQAQGLVQPERYAEIVDLATKKYLSQDDAVKRLAENTKIYEGALSLLQNKLTSLSGSAGVGAGLARYLGGAGALGVGATAAAAAIGYLYDQWIPKAKTVEDTLAEQARLIGVIKGGYEDAASAADKYLATASALTRLQQQQSEGDVRRKRNQELTAALAAMGGTQPGTMYGIPGIEMESMGPFQVSARYKEFAQAIETLNAGLSRGNPDVKTFSEEVSRIGLSAPGLQAAAQELLKLVGEAAKLDPEKIAATRRELEATAQLTAERNFNSAYDRLIQIAPEENAAIVRQQKLAQAERDRAAAMIAIENSQALSADAMAQRAKVEAAYATAIEKINKVAPEAADRYQTLTQQIRDNVIELELQERTSGRATEEVTRLKTAHDLLRAAMRAGRDVTPELRAEIDKLAESYATMTERVSRAKLSGDLAFERDQMGRSQTDQVVASRLRGAGVTVDFNDPLAQTIRINEQMRAINDNMASFASGFTRDVIRPLQEGETRWQRFGTAAVSNLQRIADQFVDMAARNLAQQAFGGAGGAGGLFASLFGGGSGLSAGASAANDNIWAGIMAAAGPVASANGNVFSAGNVVPFRLGGIVDRPTYFAMANGGIGVAGEAPGESEGVLPLRRGRDGKLGVIANGGGAPTYQDNRVFHIDARGATPDAVVLLNAKIDKLRAEVPQMSVQAVASNRVLRPGSA